MVEETFSILHKTRLKDMYRIAVILLTALLLASCGRKETLADIEARAGATAVEYYRLLQEGKYADFVVCDGEWNRLAVYLAGKKI